MQGSDEKPLWAAPERNKKPILSQIERLIGDRRTVLEVGSGTGQHAVHFTTHLPKVYWQCTDQAEYLPGLTKWITDANLKNLPHAIEFDVTVTMPDFKSPHNLTGKFDVLYTANTIHFMSWQATQMFFEKIPQLLQNNGMLFIYGPFNYKGKFTSESNEKFDASLKTVDSSRGIRDFEKVIALAKQYKLALLEDVAMPANNRFLAFVYK